LFGAICSSLPLSRFGRKNTLLLSGVLFLFAFILLGTCKETESMVAILVSRAILGFANGLVIPSCQIYVSECTESHIRGTLGSLPALFMALGTLLCYVVGAFLPWHFLSYFCAAFPILMLTLIALLPESPAWLLTKGREEDAKRSLTWLRGGKDVMDELSRIQENIHRSATTSSSPVKSLRSLLKRPVLAPLFISMSLMFFQQWCGVNAVIFYTVTIFSEAGSSIEKNLATIVVGIVQFFATFISIFLVDKAGRRILLLTSGVIMTASLAAVGAFFYMKSQNEHYGLEFLPLLGLVVFMIGYSIGFASVPFVLMGELFPHEYRSLLGAVSSCFNLTNTFLVIKLFTNISTGVGLHGVFWIYASVALLSCVFVMVFLPETKGKTLEEIEAFFRKSNESTNNNGKVPVEMKIIKSETK
jgi:facilitated trehalose transporter